MTGTCYDCIFPCVNAGRLPVSTGNCVNYTPVEDGGRWMKDLDFDSLKDVTVTVHAHDVRLLPQTNADRIRCMTDEELANALAHKADACFTCSTDSIDTCKDCWLDWLKKEVEE